MADRYTKLFTLPGRLYKKGSPVLIAAGALLKDNQTGKVLAQLKLKNISTKKIRAVKVKLFPMNTINQPLEGVVIFEYLDIIADRDEEFGQKTAVLFPNTSTRAFSAAVAEVAFDDFSVWTDNDGIWEPLPTLDVVGDYELVKQYKIHFGEKAQYKPQWDEDIWTCACGAINSKDEKSCHVCGVKITDILACNLEDLAKEKDERLLKEEAAQKEKEKADNAAAELRTKRIKKLLAIAIPAVLCLAILLGISINARTKRANEARFAQICGNYSRVDDIYSAGYKIGYERRSLSLTKNYSVQYYYFIHKYVPGFKDVNDYHTGTYTIDYDNMTIKIASSDKTLDGVVLHFTDDGELYYGTTRYKK